MGPTRQATASNGSARANRIQVELRAIACIVALAACASEVIGSIPPSQFHFAKIIHPESGKEASGWKAAQVVITLGDRYGVAVCKVEVGVPEQNLVGVVTEMAARQAAAAAADRAARQVLGSGPQLSAIRCRRFIDEMDRLLRIEIPGARVSTFVTSGLEPTTWP